MAWLKWVGAAIGALLLAAVALTAWGSARWSTATRKPFTSTQRASHVSRPTLTLLFRFDADGLMDRAASRRREAVLQQHRLAGRRKQELHELRRRLGRTVQHRHAVARADVHRGRHLDAPAAPAPRAAR